VVIFIVEVASLVGIDPDEVVEEPGKSPRGDVACATAVFTLAASDVVLICAGGEIKGSSMTVL
jgi:hypothetical protein